MALAWVPLHARGFAEWTGLTAFEESTRRLYLLLDAYGCQGDRPQFQAVVAQRARTNADVIRRMSAGGDPVCTALEPVAADLDQAAREVDLLPASFWLPPGPRPRQPPVSSGRPHRPH